MAPIIKGLHTGSTNYFIFFHFILFWYFSFTVFFNWENVLNVSAKWKMCNSCTSTTQLHQILSYAMFILIFTFKKLHKNTQEQSLISLPFLFPSSRLVSIFYFCVGEILEGRKRDRRFSQWSTEVITVAWMRIKAAQTEKLYNVGVFRRKRVVSAWGKVVGQHLVFSLG